MLFISIIFGMQLKPLLASDILPKVTNLKTSVTDDGLLKLTWPHSRKCIPMCKPSNVTATASGLAACAFNVRALMLSCRFPHLPDGMDMRLFAVSGCNP